MRWDGRPGLTALLVQLPALSRGKGGADGTGGADVDSLGGVRMGIHCRPPKQAVLSLTAELTQHCLCSPIALLAAGLRRRNASPSAEPFTDTNPAHRWGTQREFTFINGGLSTMQLTRRRAVAGVGAAVLTWVC